MLAAGSLKCVRIGKHCEDNLIQHESNKRTETFGRSDSEDAESDIISLLNQLNSKMDVLTSTVSENSTAIKNIDVRLTAKIDNLESSVAESINKVKVEVESRILDFTTDVNQRLNNIAAATQSSCQENAKLAHGTTSNLEKMQNVNKLRFNKMERELLRNELS